MGIIPKQIFAHIDSLLDPYEETPTKGPEFGKIWYASRDVGKAPKQVIPRALTEGFLRENEFEEALFDDELSSSLEEVILDELKQENFQPGFNVEQLHSDIKDFTKDPNLIRFLMFGVPQSYCGRFETIFHKNLPMTQVVREKTIKKRDEQIEKNNTSEPMFKDELLKILQRVMSNPVGGVPKNSAEKMKARAGETNIKYRTIYHASKKGIANQSLNGQTFINHDVEFLRFQDIEAAILKAVERIHELGFESHVNRVRVFKSDISAAYRIIRTAIADYWLGVWGVCEPLKDGSPTMKYVIEKCQQFGQRKSVTIFSRLVYQLTAIMSQPGWAQKFFPDMALPHWEGQGSNSSRPPPEKIEEALKKFKDAVAGNHGVLDPDVFFFLGYYLDDCHGVSIDVRDDISTPLEPNEDGIRNPIGKAISFFLKRYGIAENIEKRILENDDLLMGGTDVITLGIRIDTNALRCYVREDYRNALINDIDTWISNPSKRHSAEDWGNMEGRLGFCMIVYGHFRAFLREIWRTYAAILNNDQRACCASKIILENLAAVKTILSINPGRSLRHNRHWRTTYQRGLEHCFKSPNTMDLMSDASTGIGFGMVNTKTGEYYFRAWTKKELELAKRKKIYVLEAAATFIMFVINSKYLKESNLNIIGDNEGLVRSFHSAGSKSSPVVNEIIREMIIDLSVADITLNCDKERFDNSWCNTHEMCAADALSRNDMKTFNSYVKTKFPNVEFKQLDASDERVQSAEARWSRILDQYVSKAGFEINTSTKKVNTSELK